MSPAPFAAWLAGIVIFAVLVGSLAFYVTRGMDDVTFRLFVGERGPMEIVQSSINLAALVVFARSVSVNRGAIGAAGATLAVLLLAFGLRELDLRELAGVPQWLQSATDSPAHDAIFFGLLALALALVYHHRRHVPAWVRMAREPRSLTLHAAAVFLLAGMVLDSDYVRDSNGRFWEELFECYGYMLLLTAAVLHLERAQSEHVAGGSTAEQDASARIAT
jgi:hypothetical protein